MEILLIFAALFILVLILLGYAITQVTKMEYRIMRQHDDELYGYLPKDNNIGRIIDVTIEEMPDVNTVENSSKTV